MTQIVDRKVEFEPPWFQVVARSVAGESAPYYSLRMQDYVCVIAIRDRDELVLVRQYRPAVERPTLELPSSHVESKETPADSARSERAEECGLDAPRLELLGTLIPVLDPFPRTVQGLSSSAQAVNHCSPQSACCPGGAGVCIHATVVTVVSSTNAR